MLSSELIGSRENQSAVPCDNDVIMSDWVRFIRLRHLQFHAITLYLILMLCWCSPNLICFCNCNNVKIIKIYSSYPFASTSHAAVCVSGCWTGWLLRSGTWRPAVAPTLRQSPPVRPLWWTRPATPVPARIRTPAAATPAPSTATPTVWTLRPCSRWWAAERGGERLPQTLRGLFQHVTGGPRLHQVRIHAQLHPKTPVPGVWRHRVGGITTEWPPVKPARPSSREQYKVFHVRVLLFTHYMFWMTWDCFNVFERSVAEAAFNWYKKYSKNCEILLQFKTAVFYVNMC